ncbi:MAG: hypothetical protein WBE90_08750 [Xanthobacteraceae bacterium]
MLAQFRMQQIRHVDDHLVGVDPLRRQRLLARKGEKPLRQRRGALGGCRRGAQEALDAEIAPLNAAGDEIMRAHDHAQHIVEVMRDAAGELARRFHLLRLPDLAFRGLTARGLLEELFIGRDQAVAGGSSSATA